MKIRKDHFRYQQFDWDCGVACYLMIAVALGLPEPEFAATAEKLSANSEYGTTTQSIEHALFNLNSNLVPLEFQAGENGTIELLEKLVTEDWLVTICFLDLETGEGHFSIVQEVNSSFIVLANPESGPMYSLPVKKFVWSTGFEVPQRKGWYAAVRRCQGEK